MTTKYEGQPPISLLFHGYRYSPTPEYPLSPRNTALLAATRYMQREGYHGEAIGKVVVLGKWDQQGRGYVDRIKEALIDEGIPERDIMTNPKTKTTVKEIEVFLGLQENNGWANGASLATRTHMPRVERAYKKRGVRYPTVIVAEDVLKSQVEKEDDLRARALLDYFDTRRNTWRFEGKEFILRRAPEGLLEAMAGNSVIEKIQASSDG